MAILRVLVSSDAYVRSPTFTDADGEAADCASTPTCAVTRDDGTALTAAVVSDDTGTGVYKAKLEDSIHTTRLDWLTLTWTGTNTALGGAMILTQQVEVVGGFYLSVPEMRALGGLESTTTYPAYKLRDACSEFERIAEDFNGVAWVPRYHREKLQGDGYTSVLLEKVRVRSVISADSTDENGTVTAFTTTNWAGDTIGRLITDGDTLTASPYGRSNLTIRYTHGHDSPPDQLRRAAKIYVQAELLADRAQIGRKVLSETDPGGFTQRFGTANWQQGRPTGIEDVDKILVSLGRKAPMVA